MEYIIYLKLNRNIRTKTTGVRIKDMGTVYCAQPGIKNKVENLKIIHSVDRGNIVIPFSDTQKQAVRSVIELYSKDSNLMTKVRKTFMDEWMKRPNLNKLKLWWDKLPYAFSITSVGKVLAHANAQRCDKTLPPLN